MRNTLKTLLVCGGLLAAASVALAQEATSPQAGDRMPGMMQNQDGTSGMMGMMGMMQVMQQMGPMMEQCNKMMAAMTDHMKSTPRAPGTPAQ